MKKKYVKLANHGFLRNLLGWMIRRYYRIHASGTDSLDIKGSYLLMPNHMGLWDPLVISACVTRSINYITSDNQFRSKPLAWLFNQLGCIPKKKAIADFRAIKNMIHVKNEGGVIGIFPEGKRSWNGCTDDILFSTAKLIKTLKIPVVSAVMRGGYLSRPRWASQSRRGKLFVDFSLALTPEEIEQMTVEEIYHHMTAALSYDEYAWQKEHQIAYKGKKLAEKLELALFMCPHCQTIGAMTSENEYYTCSHCNYSVVYNQFGYFSPQGNNPLYHDNPRDWHDWQLIAFKEFLAHTPPENARYFTDKDLTLFTAENGQATMKAIGTTTASLYKDRIECLTRNKRYVFIIAKIRGINVQANYKVDFYYEEQLYQFCQPDRKVSALKWKLSVDLLQSQFGCN